MSQNTENKYLENLINIAKIQKKLLSYSFDMKTRTAADLTMPQRAGLFGLRKTIPYAAYEKLRLLSKLESAVEEADKIAVQLGIKSVNCWWRIDWRRVEEYLIYDLAENAENDGWQFERLWETVKEDELFVLMLKEEGHCSSFDGQYDLNFYETSQYSDTERKNMVKKHTNEMNKQDLYAAVAYKDYAVRSLASEKTYDSIDEYLLSAEHYMFRDVDKHLYERSLSTQHQQNITVATSRSVHYHSVYTVSDYHITKNGLLYNWSVGHYELIGAEGRMPEKFVDERKRRDASVACAAFMAEQSELISAPVSIFEDFFFAGIENENDRMMFAEIFTCLADKLSVYEDADQ